MGNIIYSRQQIVTGSETATYTQDGLVFAVDAEDYPMGLSGSNVTKILGHYCRADGVGFPQYSATGLNGRPAFMFDGAIKYFNFGDILDNGSSANVDNIFAGADVKFTCMIACRKTGLSNTRTVLLSKYGSETRSGFFIEISDTNIIRVRNSNSSESNTLQSQSTNSFYDQNVIITLTFDATISPNTDKQKLRVNGVSQILNFNTGQTNSGLGSDTSAQFRISTLQASDLLPFYGAIKTVVFWNRILNSTELPYNEGIMNTKAGGIY